MPWDTHSISSVTPATGPAGQVAHPLAIAHHQRLTRHFYTVGEHAWCLVGNGLSNQTFVRGPEGIIAIDTGESIEEMRSALDELRAVTDEPIVAVIYSHFHYVAGTQAIFDAQAGKIDVYGHRGIPANLQRFGGEIAARSSRGMVHQFGISLPAEGPDGLLHCGLGLHYRNPEHAPFTPGYIRANIEFDSTRTYTIAGLTVEITPAPSDATDSVTIHFPELKLAVNNLVWPALFNIYAIRGEEYRDPRILLEGIDHIAGLAPEALLGTHGPPLEGAAYVASSIELYRDSIAFIWDQTVRGANQGLTLADLTARISLPECFAEGYLTQQLYGLVEHHVRQIHSGLFGWFDEDPSHLFALPSAERARRLIAGFGGADTVRAQIDQALSKADWRWALELATWLVQKDPQPSPDAPLLAAVLRGIAGHTPSANVRNWCLTRALELEGSIDLSRHRQSRFGYQQVLAAAPTHFIPILRVLVDPERCAGLRGEIAWQFPGTARVGLAIRNHVAVPTDGAAADVVLGMSHETWAALLALRLTFSAGIEQGLIAITGDSRLGRELLSVFDHAGLNT
ncbi:MAG: alkyl sulfatase dimerization domain-containing protein [Pseudomonadota bacterium]